jgi:hypothetical protein
MLYAFEANDSRALHATLALSDLYLPSHAGADEIEEHTARPGEEIPLPTVDGPDGTTYIAAYSSLSQLARAEGSIGYMRLRGRDLARLAPPGLGLAVNPAGDLGFPLAADELAALATLEPPDDEEAGYLLGEPKHEPEGLLAAMRQLADARDDVIALYRALLVRTPGATPEHLVGIEVGARTDAQAVVDAAFEACRAAGVDRAGFVPIQPGFDSGPVGRFMLDRTTPFWAARA